MKSCNQCHKEMEYSLILETRIEVDVERYYLHFCINQECPNFGLLQVPLEDMPNDKTFGKNNKTCDGK